MLIGSRQKLSTLSSQPELSIDNIQIEKVTSVKSLGIFIDENLRWQKRTSINYLKRLLPGQEQLKELEILFQHLLSIVYITLSFNLSSIIVILSGVTGEKLFLDRLQRLQNRTARGLTFSRYDADANCLFRQLNWFEHSVSNTKSLNGLQVFK